MINSGPQKWPAASFCDYDRGDAKGRMTGATRDPTLGELIAVDQSLSCPGVAVFRAGRLVASASLPQRGDTKTPIAQRTLVVASHVCAWLADYITNPRTLVIEWPQVYTATKSKGDPNDLMGVAAVGTAIAGMLSHAVYQNGHGWCLQVLSPKPAEWAGQLPKATNTKLASDSPRARRVLSRLDDYERQVATLKHDALDAIGIGLWVLGRLDPQRVFPGASKAPVVTHTNAGDGRGICGTLLGRGWLNTSDQPTCPACVRMGA